MKHNSTDGVAVSPGPRWHEDLRALLLELRPLTAYGVVGSRDVDQARYRTALDKAVAMLDGTAGVAVAPELEHCGYCGQDMLRGSTCRSSDAARVCAMYDRFTATHAIPASGVKGPDHG